MKTLSFFKYSLSEECEPCEGGTIIAKRGYARLEDYYLCVPKNGLFFRPANNMRYGLFMVECYIDGEFVGATRMDKRNNITRLYNEGHIYDARQYALGYMLWRETSIGGNHINRYKEAARISHAICDTTGKIGHEQRQSIRKNILYGSK